MKTRRLRLACCVLAIVVPVAAAFAAPLTLDGEIIAKSTTTLSPPSISTLWNLNITKLTADGTPVKKGDIVLSFDGGDTQNKLNEKQSALNEKRTQLERLTMDLAEREKAERLATEERRAALDKAQRKATQPEDLLRRVDYRKLVIERRQAEAQMKLAARREVLAAEQRRQERRLTESEVAQLENEVAELQRALASLDVAAPRDGVMLHRSNFQGEKFDVGSQVFRGQAIAEVPDLSSLAVRATLPERDFTRVAAGARARVSLEGGAGRSLLARVEEIAPAVRSKSRVQPVPVIDVRLALEGDLQGLKPGQPVRVEILDAAP